MAIVPLARAEYGAASGPPIVAIHGGQLSGAHWRRIASEELSERRWICPDLRGHGSSPLRPSDLPLEEWWSVAQMAEDVIALLNSMSLGRFDLIGFSIGGRISWEVARRCGSRVRSIVSLDPGIVSRAEIAELQSRRQAMKDDPSRVNEWQDLDEFFDYMSAHAWGGRPLSSTDRSYVEQEVADLMEQTASGGIRRRVSDEMAFAIRADVFRNFQVPVPSFTGRMLAVVAAGHDAYSLEGYKEVKSALGDRLEYVSVDGPHTLLWHAFHATASVVREFLRAEDRSESLV